MVVRFLRRIESKQKCSARALWAISKSFNFNANNLTFRTVEDGSRLAAPSASESPLNSDQVWVNTTSGKYWKPGSRYYGKTKHGEYMSEKEAVQKGYLPANGIGE